MNACWSVNLSASWRYRMMGHIVLSSVRPAWILVLSALVTKLMSPIVSIQDLSGKSNPLCQRF
jgi:hypothetical protein